MTLGAPARHLGSVDSTMSEAARWAADGAPHGALVTARSQRRGRGRHGRAWQSAPSESVLATVVLRPALEADRLGLVPLAAGLAVAEAVGAFGVAASVKWPNDVRVDGRKLAGVLAEARAGGRPLVLLGVGVNVAQASFPPGLEATSLRMVTGRAVRVEAVLEAVLRRLSVHLGALPSRPGAVLEAVERRLERPAGGVEVRDPVSGGLVSAGRVVGLAPDGGLRLETEAGERVAYAGEVTLAAP